MQHDYDIQFIFAFSDLYEKQFTKDMSIVNCMIYIYIYIYIKVCILTYAISVCLNKVYVNGVKK